MSEFDLKNLKQWREERGLTILDISKMTGMRTVTIKALEEGKQKPQKRSLDKLLKFISEFPGTTITPPKKEAPAKPKAETPTVTPEAAPSPKKRGRPRKEAPKVEAPEKEVPKPKRETKEKPRIREEVPPPPPEEAKPAPPPQEVKPAPELKKGVRGRKKAKPPKPEAKPASILKPEPGAPEITLPTGPTPTPAPVSEVATPSAKKPEFASPIQLTNLDLELINRVLNLTLKEKLDLIARLSQGE